ncbi:MAG: alpha/beta hydrolase [Bacteroidales bacterium]|jgi:pimeloyl-ACP methyl ester carboxylesterase|nr:alpha/beta hydrolase [Bacteroidales bacterium]
MIQKINYRRSSGTEKPLVLLHGFMESQAIWDPFFDALGEERCVITLDLPGHGQTQQFAEIYTMSLMAECVKSVLDAENIEKATIIGHSMGGYVALEFAYLFPERTVQFGLFHSQAAAETEQGRANRNRAVEALKQNKKGFISQLIPDLFAPENIEKYQTEIQKLIEIAQTMSVENIIAATLGMRDRNCRLDMLRNAKKAVIFIQGKQDKRFPDEMIFSQIQLCNQAEVLYLNCGHMGFLECEKEATEFLKL